MSSWSYRKKLTFNNAGQAEDLIDFPVLVHLTTSNFIFSHAQSAGQDIRFLNSDDSTQLKYEIEKWTANTEAWIWVKVPQIHASSSTDYILMYYGNSGASDAQDPASVWNSNFKGVWHLKEDPSGTAPQMKDSTSNANHGHSHGSMTSGDQVAGKIDGSLDHDGSDDEIHCGNAASLQITTQVTIEAWAKRSDTSSLYAGIAGKLVSNSDTSYKGYNIQKHDTTNKYRFVTGNGGGAPDAGCVSNSAYTDTNWHYVVGVRRSGTNYLYIDGVQQTATSTTSITDSGDDFDIGRQYTDYDGRWWNGRIDEVRVSNIGRSAAWIKAQYLNMTDAFTTFGSETSKITKIVFTTTAQTMTAGQASAIMTIQTQNASSNPVNVDSDTTVTLSSTSANGKFSLSNSPWIDITSVTIVAASNSVSFYYKDTTAGAPTITAAESPSEGWTDATQQQTVNPAALDHFTFATISSPQTAGTGFTITIMARDAYNNNVTSYTNTNTLSDSTGTIAPTSTGAFSSGAWTGSVTITKAQSGITITTSGSGKSGTSNSFTVNAAALDHFTFATISSPQTAGTGFTITIMARDAYNNNVTSYTNTNTLSDSTGTIAPTSTGAFSSGAWTGSVTITKAQSGITITTSGSGKSGTSNSFTVNAAALDHFTFATISPQGAGAAFAITVTGKDAYNNTVTSYTGSNTLSDSTGTISPTSTGPFMAGTWTGNVTIYKVQAGITIATLGAGKSGTSNAFDVTAPGELCSFIFTTISSPQTAGVSFTITVTAKDAWNNTITTYAGSNSLSDSTGTITPTSTGAFSSGIWTGIVTITKAQAGITITTTGGGRSGTSNSFTVNAAALDHFTFAPIGVSQTAGASFTITITSKDAYNNTVTSYTGSNMLSDLTGSINPTSTGAFSSGTWSGTVTITKAQTGVTITTSGGGKSATSGGFNVNPAGVSKLTIIIHPYSVVQGSWTLNYTVQRQDPYGNPVTTGSSSVNLTSNSTGVAKKFAETAGGASITFVTIPDGSSTKSFYYYDEAPGIWAISVSATGLTGDSKPLTVLPLVTFTTTASTTITTTSTLSMSTTTTATTITTTRSTTVTSNQTLTTSVTAGTTVLPTTVTVQKSTVLTITVPTTQTINGLEHITHTVILVSSTTTSTTLTSLKTTTATVTTPTTASITSTMTVTKTGNTVRTTTVTTVSSTTLTGPFAFLLNVSGTLDGYAFLATIIVITTTIIVAFAARKRSPPKTQLSLMTAKVLYPPPMFCTSCGARRPPVGSFCTNCGNKLY